MFTWNFLRLKARPPEKGPPPKNFVDLFYDPETGKIHAKNAADAEVMFNAAGGAVSTGDLTTEPGNGSAAAGELGEYKSKGGTFPISSATPTSAPFGQPLTLTPGDWDVHGWCIVSETNCSCTVRRAAISTSSNSFDASSTSGFMDTPTSGLFGNVGVPVPSRRFSISVDTPIYLVGSATFSLGTAALTTGLHARRVR